MNIASKLVFATLSGLAFMTGAHAQAAPSGSTAPAAAQGSFSRADIQKFATAAVEMNKIQADATIPAADKQAKMAGAAQKQGLDPTKFNAIAEAAQSDPALKQQIQVAAASQQPSKP